MNKAEIKRLANAVWVGWQALHRSPVAGKGHEDAFCSCYCDPDAGVVPCEYCVNSRRPRAIASHSSGVSDGHS